jgi:hypothetical protein
MKKLSIFALVAALLTGACGTIEYSDVTVIDPTRTLYVTVETPPGAAIDGEDDFNTSCSNPAVSIDGIPDVAGFLTDVMADAYEEDFGVVHLCAGTYVTEDIIEFPNLGSITIEGDGVDETIISGADGDDHALLAMVSAECLLEDEPCPSYFNVLTLKDLTLTNGVGGDEVFDTDVDGDGDLDGIPMLAGGAVTAPLVATERVRFSNNSAPCGGAIALYGWTQLASDGEFTAIEEGVGDEAEDALAAAEYFSSLISLGSSQITDTEFIENSAAIGGAIGGAPLGALAGGEEVASCLNTGPLSIVNSTFEGNQAVFDVDTGIGFGGGAIATANLFVFELGLDSGADEEAILTIFNRDVWLNIAGSTFTDNNAADVGGAVISYGKTSISRTTFTNNSVDPSGTAGGAIALVGELSLSYSKLVGNSATSGGAVALLGTLGGEHVLTRNTFTQNIAADQGGAISGWIADGVARGNRFTSNRAPLGSAVAVEAERCSRSVSRRAARDWRGNTFRQNRGGRLPVECYVVEPAR